MILKLNFTTNLNLISDILMDNSFSQYSYWKKIYTVGSK